MWIFLKKSLALARCRPTRFSRIDASAAWIEWVNAAQTEVEIEGLRNASLAGNRAARTVEKYRSRLRSD
jgi:hypothetical protein